MNDYSNNLVSQTAPPKNKNLFKKFLLGISPVLTIFLFIILYRMAFKPATLTVTGDGEAGFTPTNVSMLVTKVDVGKDAVRVINQGDTNVKVLMDSAKNVVAGEAPEINKIFYQVKPVAALDGSSYQVVNAFSLKFNSVDKASEMIKTLYQDGATTVSSVVFSSDDESLIEQEARKMAVKDAKEKAGEIAKASGKRLGRMITIIDDDKSAEGAVTKENSDQPPQITLEKSVSIIFEVW